MNNSNIEKVKIYDAEKVHDRFFGKVSILIKNEEVKLIFGIDYLGYLSIKNIIQFRPFKNSMNENFSHYFGGVYNKSKREIRIKVEKGLEKKQFWLKCDSEILAQNLLWFDKILEKKDIQHLLDVSDENLFEKIKNFTNKKTNVKIHKLTRHTRVETDLGLSGQDTVEFFDAFFETFEISCPNGFNYSKYTSPENISILYFFKRLFSKKFKENSNIIELTLGDLERAALSKIWLEV